MAPTSLLSLLPAHTFLSACQQLLLLLLLHVLRTRNVPVIIIVFGEKGPTTCVRLTPFCWTGLSVSCLALLCVRDTTSLLIIPSSCSIGTREPRASCLVPPAYTTISCFSPCLELCLSVLGASSTSSALLEREK